MKIQVTEFDKCFSIELTAETMEEAGKLVRLGMNRTDKIQFSGTAANTDGTFTSTLCYKKNHRASHYIPKRK